MTYGIIGAMDSEIQMIRGQMDYCRTNPLYGLTFYQGRIGSHDVILAKCGIGKVNAARCAQILIDRSKPDYLINTGVAGGVGPELKLGDMVLSTDLVQHDFRMAALGCVDGCLTLDGPKDKPTLFPADQDLLDRFEAVARAIAGESAIHRGRICTGDTFVADQETKKRLFETYGALACEMEGGAIAQVAQAAYVPFLVVRAISDLADGSASESYAAFERHAAHLSATMLLKFLEDA
ncbi:MAG: 5'-methylthioadenosine/adenosylhomocysteine nucleosidase [Clostridia bacterium]|nr:5'-methylthioadenosine/adenosylhomocysteine nucleosidase [Clostridia bacterium]